LPKAKDALILFSAGGMDLCWIFAIVAFLFYVLGAGTPPLTGIFIAFCCSAALNSFLQGRGWRVIMVLATHLLVFSGVLACVFYLSGEWAAPFFSLEWLREAGAKFQDPAGSLFRFLVACFVVLTWVGGVMFSRRSTAYSVITSRFDLGVFIFFLLFLLEGGAGMQKSALLYFLFPFFLFSMFTIALAHSRSMGEQNNSHYLASGKTGVVLGICGALLLGAGGILLVLTPGMTRLAEVGYALGRQILSPVVNVLLKILSLFYGGRSGRSMQSDPAGAEAEILVTEMLPEYEVHLWEKYLATGLGVFLALIAVFAVVLGLIYLYRNLMARTPKTLTNSKKDFSFKAFLAMVIAFCKKAAGLFLWLWKTKLRAGLFSAPAVKGAGTMGYEKLLRWGRRGGLPRRLAETPREYGDRLEHTYPFFKEEIYLIIHGYQEEVYGELRLPAEQSSRIKQAMRRLTVPMQIKNRVVEKYKKASRRLRKKV